MKEFKETILCPVDEPLTDSDDDFEMSEEDLRRIIEEGEEDFRMGRCLSFSSVKEIEEYFENEDNF